MTLLREWLQNCDRTHGCRPRQALEGAIKIPTRLIDVGGGSESGLRLVETNATLNAKYIALSHCWGNIQEESKFCTYRENIKKRKTGIDFDKLPRSFQDAVKITKALGVRYLWIDSICIIQRDKDDWETEAGNMEDVFSSAYCTIAASSARSSLEGFIHNRKPRSCVIARKQDRTFYLCKAMDNFRYDVEEAPLNKRGWVLQERALSRRTIHYTFNQVYWECGEGVHCETLAKLRKYVS